MFRLLLILGAGLFLTLLIGGRDAGQTRLGLQGAYEIAALNDPPRPEPVGQVTPAGATATAAAQPAPAPPPVAPRATQASFAPAAPTAVTGDQSALQTGLTLALPLVAEPAEPATVAAATAPLRVGRILGSAVNVREAPSAKSAVLDRLARDETVTVISTDETGWSLVRVEGDGVEGYVATRYLSAPAGDSALFPSE